MANGDESCCELPKMDAIDNLAPENQDQVIQQSLFTDNGESAQEERDRKEEEERKEREALQAQMEAQKAAEEETKKSNNRTNRFKSWYNSFLNASETFFEDKDDNNTKN